MDCMSRRQFLGASTAMLAASAASGQASERPNVLIIQPDQHRGTIMGCAGDREVHTPNLDRLGSQGIRFSRCVSASPVCSPFRATMHTGLHPHKHGLVTNNILLDPEFRCFPEVFAESGYATGYIGKWHLDGGRPAVEGGEGVTPSNVGGFVPPGGRQGWQEWHGYEKSHEYFEVWQYNEEKKKARVKGYDWEPTWHTDVALDFARRNRDARKPWLYYLAYGPPHLPEQCPREFLDRYDPAGFSLPPDIEGRFSPEEEKRIRGLRQMYYGQVTAIDHEVGRVMKGLEDLGVADNTIIIYTSDHGDILGSHWDGTGNARGKGAPYATAFRIPLMVRWPKRIKPEQVCEVLVSSIDLTPTLMDLAGMPAMPGMQGDSMAGWCLNGNGPSNEAVWLGLRGWRAAWDGRYVYSRGKQTNHLYDHQADPHEMKNLIASPDHGALRRRMHTKLLKVAEGAEDPMLGELRAMAVT
jgi:arylsulfatase A-like enzyme